MPEVEGQEKTEQATPKKLQDAREKGHVARSFELNSLVVFTVGFISLFLFKETIGRNLSSLTVYIFSSLNSLEISSEALRVYSIKGFLFFIKTIFPFMLAIVLGGVIANIYQVGFKITPQALGFKFSKINPFAGIKRIFFSTKSLFEVIKSILKLILIGAVAYFVLKDYILSSLGLIDLTISESLQIMSDEAFAMILKIGLVYAVLAAIDFAWQKHTFKKEMMMTKQEVKEEYKQLEGDPQIKSRIKKEQLMAAKRRMMQEVPKADVVITNPTHFAVALKYNPEKDSAPKVVAKGVDEVAQRIKSIAMENGVHIHEDRELARALYKSCDIGDTIPREFFKAVAEILAFVYQMKIRQKKKKIA